MFKTIQSLSVVFLLTIIFQPIFVNVDAKAEDYELKGVVSYVNDGDTFVLEDRVNKRKYNIRLYGLDADEIDHGEGKNRREPGPYGEKARIALEKMIKGSFVRVFTLDISYERLVGIVYLGDRNICLEMIRAGHAKVYKYYLRDPYKDDYIKAEEEAKKDKIGIWKE